MPKTIHTRVCRNATIFNAHGSRAPILAAKPASGGGHHSGLAHEARLSHDNPKRKGIVIDPTAWRFSSAAWWLLDMPGYSDVILTAIEW